MSQIYQEIDHLLSAIYMESLTVEDKRQLELQLTILINLKHEPVKYRLISLRENIKDILIKSLSNRLDKMEKQLTELLEQGKDINQTTALQVYKEQQLTNIFCDNQEGSLKSLTKKPTDTSYTYFS